ncbi:RCC1 domain-containing protein 1 isoform X2 [Falco biarmicus]|uniref:RCC1 domain-containing protein 1 isoform X2 n=1 Tax=Falco biarmicus TaxID=345155 RepID=UPI0024BD2A73|nr:RCC1 domain-containing protein 1 isoform X2 [Falco biarmicus]
MGLTAATAPSALTGRAGPGSCTPGPGTAAGPPGDTALKLLLDHGPASVPASAGAAPSRRYRRRPRPLPPAPPRHGGPAPRLVRLRLQPGGGGGGAGPGPRPLAAGVGPRGDPPCLARLELRGRGDRHGQLGHGTLESVKEPRLVEALAGVPMQTVAAGGWHSASVSEAGDLYMWGWNESGQLALPSKGLAEEQAQDEDTGAGNAELPPRQEQPAAEGTAFISIQAFPALLDLPQDLEVSKVSCGSRHTAVITRGGELYTWGWGKYGQLGHRDNASSDQPRRVEHLVAEGLQAEEVVCGLWTTYVCVLEPEP